MKLADPWFAAATGRFERVHDVRVWGDADQAVAEPAGKFGAAPATGGHDDRRWLGRPSVELGVLNGENLPRWLTSSPSKERLGR
jgi:hypothetical protein